MSVVNIKRSWVAEMDEENALDDSKAAAKKGGSRESSSSRKKSKMNKKEINVTDQQKQAWTPKKPIELETDPSVLQRRQKQIDYGKNTVGYNNYITQVPIDQRTKEHPKTPDKFSKYSRRSWDTLIQMWRLKLHNYDTASDSGEDNIKVIEEDDDSVLDDEE